MLDAAIASATDIASCDSFDPWQSVRLPSKADIVADRKRCRDNLLVWRKDATNSSLRNCAPESVASSVNNAPISRSGVRVCTSVEAGDVQFRSDEPHDPGLPGIRRDTPSPCKEKKKRRTSRVPFSAKRNFLLKDSPPSTPRNRTSLEEDPIFEGFLDKKFERAGTRKSHCNRRAVPIHQMG